MKVEWISINKIIPYARNPRRNDGLPVAKVKASLLEFGWQQPIVVDENFVILAGHRPLLRLKPTHRWISASEATKDLQELTAAERDDTKATGTDKRFWLKTKPGMDYSNAALKETGKDSFFNHYKLHPYKPSNTLIANCSVLNHWLEMRKLTFREWKRLGSFPDDYYAKSDKIGKYMVGMSVPPKMTEQVARAVIDQWLSK